MTSTGLYHCLNRFPGAGLALSVDGSIRASNGRLDTLVGRDLIGVPMAEILDSTSQAKWKKILSAEERTSPACTWELVLTTPSSLELRTFLAVREDAGAETLVWLLEYAMDPKLEKLYGELSELHGEVVQAQRQLGRERNRLARALEKAEAAIRSRNDVLAIVSHDLRNPVSTIAMAAAVLELPISEEKKAEQIAIVKRAGERMNRLIGDLLDLTAVESGQLRLEVEAIHLPPVLDEVCRLMGEQAAQKRVGLSCRIPTELPVVSGDRDRILQVLMNLVGNAVKFTPDGGSITIRAVPAEEEVIVTVEDTGHGIDEADLPRIFDRFWHTSRERRGGAGLGLAIVKGIVEAHGGRAWVESEPGRGSTFSFALPKADPSQPAQSTSHSGPGAKS